MCNIGTAVGVTLCEMEGLLL